MTKRRVARCLLYAALLLTAADPGCQTFQKHNTISVLVQDAETKQPVSGAEVKLMCLSARATQHPPQASGATGGDGVVRLAASADADTALVEGIAKGYLTEESSIPVTALQPVKPSSAGGKPPVNFVLEVYAEPAATVELVVPTDYRGLVKIEVEIQSDVPSAPGQRSLRCGVPSSGVIHLKGSPLLRHLRAAHIHAIYPDGTRLPQPDDALTVGLRWLKCENLDQYFVVGTQIDWEAARRLLARPAGDENRSSGGGKGGGGGGRGHRRGGGGGGGGD